VVERIVVKFPDRLAEEVVVHKFSKQGEAWITTPDGHQRWIPKHWILPKVTNG